MIVIPKTCTGCSAYLIKLQNPDIYVYNFRLCFRTTHHQKATLLSSSVTMSQLPIQDSLFSASQPVTLLPTQPFAQVNASKTDYTGFDWRF